MEYTTTQSESFPNGSGPRAYHIMVTYRRYIPEWYVQWTSGWWSAQFLHYLAKIERSRTVAVITDWYG